MRTLDSTGIAERAKAVNVKPLWTNPLHGANPNPPAPILWPWRDIAPLVDEAAADTSTEVVDRRVLSLIDPKYPENGTASIRNLNAGFQVLMPGERARPHRHSMSAIRFVIEGSGATTVVDGRPCPMNWGDLILTPEWTWHEHTHGGSERIVWLDVLDAQLHRFLETDVFEPGPIHDLVPPAAEVKYYYPWSEAREALRAVAAGADGLRRIRYVNPVTGGAVMSLIDCELWDVPAGTETRPASTTAHQVCTVVEGAGSSRVGNSTVAWTARDVFSLPAGQPVTHTSAAGGARIFVVSDREVLRRLDLLIERVQEHHEQP